MILYEIGYVIFCIILAAINDKLIEKGKMIHHAVNGVLHLACFVGGYFVMGWKVVALPFLGRIVFDTALNLFRGLPIFYVSLQPKSIVDQLEIFFFGRNGWLPKLIYLIIVIVINIV